MNLRTLVPARAINRIAERIANALPHLVGQPAPVAAHIAPVGLFEPDEIPPVDEIVAAAKAYQQAASQARAADRTKRAAKKLLDRLPIGTYAGWSITREPSGRQTADLDKIKAIFKAHGLGDIPMKTAAPTIKVARVETPAPVAAAAEAVTA